MKASHKLVEALVNLRQNRDFQTVLEAMAEYEVEEMQRCVDYEGASLHRSQGGVKVLQWWKTTFIAAPTLFEKFKQQAN